MWNYYYYLLLLSKDHQVKVVSGTHTIIDLSEQGRAPRKGRTSMMSNTPLLSSDFGLRGGKACTSEYSIPGIMHSRP